MRVEEKTMKAVKNLSVVLVVFACLPLGHARASFTILNETYHVEGGSWYGDRYDVTQSSPPAQGATAWVESHATRYQIGSDVYFEAAQASYWSDGGYQESAEADLMVDFRGSGRIEAWRYIDNYSWASATLTLMADGIAWETWDLLPPAECPGSPWVAGSVPVQLHASWYFPPLYDPDEFYRLEMYAGQIDYNGSSVIVEFLGVGPVIVPAPGAVLLSILGAGLVGLLSRRRAL
jgi:hypothetical protein